MSLISKFKNANTKRFQVLINEIHNKTGKSKLYLWVKFIWCAIFVGATYTDYRNFEFYNRPLKEIKTYVTQKDEDNFYEITSPKAYRDEVALKNNFIKNYGSYVSRDIFYDGTIEELKEFIGNKEFFIEKPNSGTGGHGVSKVFVKDIKDLNEYHKYVLDNKVQLEECVIQHHKMAEFAPGSVNTIRVVTFQYNGKARILDTFARFGNGTNVVDNFHAGGMSACIDIESGKITTDAANGDAVRFEKHPYSGLTFKGFQIPNWEIVKETVLRGAMVSEHLHTIGWDIAVTEDGCTVIEANRRPGWDASQTPANYGKRYILLECIDEMNKVDGTNLKL